MQKQTIAVMTPSSPLPAAWGEATRRSIRQLETLGYEVLLGETVFRQQGIRTGTPRFRAAELMQFFENPAVSAIFVTRGGYNSNEMLEFLDFERIRKNPKPLVGYSDMTALQLGVMAKSGTPTAYGAMLTDALCDETSLPRLLATLRTGRMDFSAPSALCEETPDDTLPFSAIQALAKGRTDADGWLLAANLSTFALLMGTPYMPDMEGCILFLEYNRDELEAIPSMQRMLWQVRQGGVFRKIKGLVFGALQNSVAAEAAAGWSVPSMLAEATEGFEFPVLWNAPFGHVYPSWQLLNGSAVGIRGTQITQA